MVVIMEKVMFRSLWIYMAVSLMVGLNYQLAAQTPGNSERYNLAIYATGTQNDQPLSNSLLNIVQSKTMTKLTTEGKYRLIERSDDFLKQIKNEQNMQQSGDVADGQIAEIGAGYGAQKICVVSVTIIDKYLYIATRIVDVATKTSFESGDAEITNYKSIPVLTKTLEISLDKMLAVAAKTNTAPITPAQPTQPVESTKPAKVSTTLPASPINSQKTDDYSSQQSDKLTVAEAKAQAEKEKAKAKADFNMGFKAYKKQVIKEKGGFLGVNSLAYKEYRKYRTYLVTGSVLFSVGGALMVCGGTFVPVFCGPIGAGMVIPGVVLLSLMNTHLQKSYQYYINGDRQTATLDFHPYIGGNNMFGAGLSLRF